MSPNYYKRRKAKQLAKSLKGVEAKRRKRMAATQYSPTVQRVTSFVGCIDAYPDGLHPGLWPNKRGTRICTVRTLGKTFREMVYPQGRATR